MKRGPGDSETLYPRMVDEQALQRVAALVRSQSRSLERMFRSRLRALGFPPAQRNLLVQLTPGYAAEQLAAGVKPRQFLREAADCARALVLADLTPRKINRVLAENEKLLKAIFAGLGARERADNMSWYRQLQRAIFLMLNEAVTAVDNAELRLKQSLLDAEEKDGGPSLFFSSVLELLVQHFGAVTGGIYTAGENGPEAAAVYPPAAAANVPVLTVRDFERVGHTARVLRSDRLAEKRLILPGAGRDGDSVVWSIPWGSVVLQLAFSSMRPLQPREMQLLLRVAGRCSTALGRFDDQQRQTSLSIRMLEVEELERRRIARELHDDAGQSLVVIRLQMEMLEMSLSPDAETARSSLAEMRAITERTISGIRRLISDLSPAVLEQLGLGAAIRQLANRFRDSHPIKVRLQLMETPHLHPRLQLVIYRILQECFANISKHAKAKRVKVSLTSTDSVLRLVIEDDGVGFVVEEHLGRRNCFGLLGIRQRVSLLGGQFLIESTSTRGDKPANAVKTGTKIQVVFPLTGQYPASS